MTTPPSSASIGVDISKLKPSDFHIQSLGERPYPSPIIERGPDFKKKGILSDDEFTILYEPRAAADDVVANVPSPRDSLRLHLAHARATLRFRPEDTIVGIVTCGGLCPGLNDVIRGVTLTSILSYHCKRVIGFRYGYWGLSAEGRETIMELTPDVVRPIQRHGGTILGTSRGTRPISEMVDTLVQKGVNILFTVGGDGTQRGANAICKEVARRKLNIAIMGIPKTIDNDLCFSHRTFGFETAVNEAVRAVRAAHAEARGHQYGVGVVRLMGRDSGFITAHACIASSQAHICLIPENPISKDVFFKLVQQQYVNNKHLVIVVAEGFGQDWPECRGPHSTDASGNVKHADIGVVLKHLLEEYFKTERRFSQATVKYIDPSYMIRARPASPSDAAFCSSLSTLAVHEAFAGRTACLIASWYGAFVLVPIALAVSCRRMVRPTGNLWRQVRDVTVDMVKSPEERRKDVARQMEVLDRERRRLQNRMAVL